MCLLTMTVAGFAIYGRYAGQPVMIEGSPQLMQMAYNSALCFFIISFCIMASLYRQCLHFLYLLLFLVFIFSILVLVENVLDKNLYIDQLFFTYPVSVTTATDVGRIAPNTAISFIFSCITLAMLNAEWPNRCYIAVCGFLSLIVASAGGIYLSGYVFKVDTLYQWGNFTPMAPNTAVGFILLGGALIFLILYKSIKDKKNIVNSAPLVVSSVIFLGTILYWRALINYEAYNHIIHPLHIPTVTLVVGICIALLVGLTVRYGIHSRHYAGKALKEAEKTRNALALVEATLESTKDGILVTDNNGSVINYNQQLLKIWDIPDTQRSSIMNRPGLLSSIAKKIKKPENYMGSPNKIYTEQMEETFDEIELNDGRIIECYTKPRRTGSKVVGLVASYRDVTERKKMLEELVHQNTYDSLTNLPNQLLLRDRIKQAVSSASQSQHIVAVLFFNVNHFKYFNDSFGTQVGDQLLKEIAIRLVVNVENNDTIARIDSDQFVIVLAALKHEEDCISYVQKYLSILNNQFIVDGNKYRLTFRVGISFYPKDCQDAEAIMKCAETAMYNASIKDENSFHFYTEEMQKKILERITLENDLKVALENSEFVLHYQPIVDLQTGRINGVEALIRWNHPQHGLISPAKFIPIAEKSGLIVSIDDWVIKEACMKLKDWCVSGMSHIRVAINISSQQFLRGYFEKNISKTLADCNLSPNNLEIEITEGEVMESSAELIHRLESLRNLGIRISIDDFGTGYSSLSYLRKFPIHTLKIDQSFVRDLESSADAVAIIKAIIGMAKSLQLKVLVEGIENRTQLQFVRSLSCDEAQGFYFSKAVDATTMTHLLSKNHLYIMP